MGYWVPVDEENGSKTTLYYVLEHKSRELYDRNRDLLGNLGLDQLFTIDVKPADAEPAQPLVPTESSEDKLTRAQTMIEAHEACVEANPENAAKFKDVLEYLKQDLHLVR